MKKLVLVSLALLMAGCVSEEDIAASKAKQEASSRAFYDKNSPTELNKLRPLLEACVDAVLTGNPPSATAGQSIGASAPKLSKPVVNLGGNTRSCSSFIPNSAPSLQLAGPLMTEIAASRGYTTVSKRNGELIAGNGTDKLAFSTHLSAGSNGFQSLFVQLR